MNYTCSMSIDKLVRFSDGDVLFRAGDTSRSMYIIRSGRVKILIHKDGKDIPLIELGRGHFVGEMSFLTGVKRSATAIADSGVIASKIDHDILNDPELGLSGWAVSIASVLVRRIRSTTELVGDYLIRREGDTAEVKLGRRAEDAQNFEIRSDSLLKPRRIYLKGQFTEDYIEELKQVIRNKKIKADFPIVLDFSDVIDIDQSAINFIYHLIQGPDVANNIIKIENIQLIRDKLMSIKGLNGIINITDIPTRMLEQGEVLIQQGDLENVMYVVKSGAFSISRHTDNGEIELGAAEAGDVVGEMSLIKEGLRSAEVRAKTTSTVYIIDIREFYNNLYNVPLWFMDLIKALVQRLRDTNEMLDEIHASSTKKTAEDSFESPLSISMDNAQPGLMRLGGVLSLSNLQYIVPLINMEIKRKTEVITLDMSKVDAIEKDSFQGLLSLYSQLKNNGRSLKIRGRSDILGRMMREYWEKEDQ